MPEENPQPPKKTIRIRVRMEPQLEEIAGDYGPVGRLELARLYSRWARQLRVSAMVMLSDLQPPTPRALRPLPLRRLRQN